MTWTASDIALIITTSATAFSAVVGLGLPLYQDYKFKTVERSERTYQSIAEPLHYCVEHLEDIIECDRMQMMRLAYMEASQNVPAEPEDLLTVRRAFNQRLNLVYLLLSELEIDASAFKTEVTKLQATQLTFSIENGELSQGSGNEEALRKIIESKNRVVDEAANLLRIARQKLGVS